MELSNSISNEHNDETSFEINYELANTGCIVEIWSID